MSSSGSQSSASNFSIFTPRARFWIAPMLLSTTTGAWLISTVTVNWQLEEFRLASVAVQITVVVPTTKSEPEAGLQMTLGAESQASIAPGVVYVTFAPELLVVNTSVMFAGQIMLGAIVSLT